MNAFRVVVDLLECFCVFLASAGICGIANDLRWFKRQAEKRVQEP